MSFIGSDIVRHTLAACPQTSINFAIVGCGGITLQNHLPGLALCPGVKVAALCDSDAATLERARVQTGAATVSRNYKDILKRDDIHAVIIATPNVTHAAIALEAIAQGKHVLCEKPLAMNYAEAMRMADAAERSNVRHMTAFTYRFVPAMRYLAHLVKRGDLGEPYHFRSCRLQDWGTRDLGWRQMKSLAGTGELGDMLSHRIDFAHLLVGPMSKLTAMVKQWHPVRGGRPNDLEDWAALLAEFESGATGVLESSKLASGRNESWRSLDYVEINGSERSFVFTTGEWDKLQTGAFGGPGLESHRRTSRVLENSRAHHANQETEIRSSPSVTIKRGNSWMRFATSAHVNPTFTMARAHRRSLTQHFGQQKPEVL